MTGYTCAKCHGQFPHPDGWDEEEAAARAEETWGPDAGPMDHFCPDCWEHVARRFR